MKLVTQSILERETQEPDSIWHGRDGTTNHFINKVYLIPGTVNSTTMSHHHPYCGDESRKYLCEESPAARFEVLELGGLRFFGFSFA